MSDQITGWLKLWTSSGVQVSLPIPLDTPAAMLAYAESYLSAGWLKTEPSLADGETREQVGYVCRMSIRNKKDGSITPRLALYPASDQTTYKFVLVYLNNAEQQAEFEAATGLRLEDMPTWPAEAPRRGNPDTDSYIVPVKRPCAAICRNNPDYVEGSTEKVKRFFVGWQNAQPAQASPDEPAPPPQRPPAGDGEIPSPRTLTREEAVALYAWATADNGEIRISQQDLLTALKVTGLTQFVGYLEQAKSAVLAWKATF